MVGLITERHWELIEKIFPGMKCFYEKSLGKKPNTFLELEWFFVNREPVSSKKQLAAGGGLKNLRSAKR